MNRDDCEKLLDSYENIVSAEVNLGSGTAEGLNLEIAHDNLRDVIIGIMAGEKKPVYRDGGIAVPGMARPRLAAPDGGRGREAVQAFRA